MDYGYLSLPSEAASWKIASPLAVGVTFWRVSGRLVLLVGSTIGKRTRQPVKAEKELGRLARILRWLSPRYWGVHHFLGVWAFCIAGATVIMRTQIGGALRMRWPQLNAVAIQFALWSVLLPFIYIGDRIWQKIEEREDRLGREE